MGFNIRKPIFHDRQSVVVEGPLDTSSSTFSNITGATLTTKDLGETGTYDFWISFTLSHNQNNSQTDFRVLIDGSPGPTRSINRGPNTIGDSAIVSINNRASSISGGLVLQVQWSTTTGTATIDDFVISFDGIPDTRIIS